MDMFLELVKITDIWEHKFYWSFYELNNGEIIGLDNTEYFEKGKLYDMM